MNKRGSGMSDGDILVKAHTRYSREKGFAFNHEHCWELVKDHPKWSMVPMMSTPTSHASKRSKIYEFSIDHFRVADDEKDHVEIQEHQRPIGRNKAKKASMDRQQTKILLVCCLKCTGSKMSTMLPMTTE